MTVEWATSGEKLCSEMGSANRRAVADETRRYKKRLVYLDGSRPLPSWRSHFLTCGFVRSPPGVFI
jgi:hypothetical protein